MCSSETSSTLTLGMGSSTKAPSRRARRSAPGPWRRWPAPDRHPAARGELDAALGSLVAGDGLVLDGRHLGG
jgi:hypothetical protein